MMARSLAAVVEVCPDAAGQVPVDLVRAAYYASCRGTVALVLNGVSATQVDRALDPVVSELGAVAGVVYCTPATLGRLLRQTGQPQVASVGTRVLAAPFMHRGVRMLPPDRAVRMLGELSGRAESES